MNDATRSLAAALAAFGALSAAACSPDSSEGTTSTTTSTTADGGSSGDGGRSGDGGDAGGGGDGGDTSSPSSPSASSGGGDPGSGGATQSSSGSGGEAPFVDPCADLPVPACDTAYPSTAGQGLVEIDRCAFPMAMSGDWAAHDARVTALEDLLPHASVEDVLGDLNRMGTVVATVPGLGTSIEYAMRWNDEEEESTRWFPQGLTGSPDASATGLVGGRRVVLASFYDDEEDDAINKGARIAFADVTGPGAPTYRFALLVETTGTPDSPDIAPVPTHAGGIAWVGHYLYVAQTGSGFRVFDLDRMMQVDTDVDAIGCDGAGCTAGLYKYVIPQVGAYADGSACDPLFSFVALDATSDPPALVSGEYCSTDACPAPLASRLFRWPLDPATGLLAVGSPDGGLWASDAFFMGERQVQGGITIDGTAFLSSSAPAAAAGELYRATTEGSDALPWSNTPEDLMYDPTAGASGWLWSQSEGEGARFVFAVDASTLAP